MNDCWRLAKVFEGTPLECMMTIYWTPNPGWTSGELKEGQTWGYISDDGPARPVTLL